MSYEQITVLPVDIQADFRAQLHKAQETKFGAFRLVAIRRSQGGHEDRRVVVYVVDENGMAVSGQPVAFSYSTAKPFQITGDFQWMPPSPHKAHIARTEAGGKIENILGGEGVVKDGEAGGITAYMLDAEYSSDVVSGLGMLPNHQSLVLTFQRQTVGILPLAERLEAIEARLTALEQLWDE